MFKQLKGNQSSHLYSLPRGNECKARIIKPLQSSYGSYVIEISNCSLSLPECKYQESHSIHLSPNLSVIKAMTDYALNLVQQLKNLSPHECAFIEYACQDAIPKCHQLPSDYPHGFCEMIRITTTSGNSVCFIIYRREIPERWLEIFVKYSQLMEAIGL